MTYNESSALDVVFFDHRKSQSKQWLSNSHSVVTQIICWSRSPSILINSILRLGVIYNLFRVVASYHEEPSFSISRLKMFPELTKNDMSTKLTTHATSIASLGQYHSADLSPLLCESRIYIHRHFRVKSIILSRPNFDSPSRAVV